MDTLIIACSDGRLTETLLRFQSRRRAEVADRLLVPGGPLVLARPGMERRVSMECVRNIVEAGNTRFIHLISHQDCASYERALGGLGFDQREILERDLRRVCRLLENELPDVEVACWFIPWREDQAGSAFGEAERVS